MLEQERHKGGERALLVHINLYNKNNQDDLSEFIELVRSASIEDVDVIVGSRNQPKAKTFVGVGKLEEIQQAVKQFDVEIVLFNHSLSPSQERNLEAELQCRVIDRTGLILDIFSQRAKTFEGKLQVELAQLKHLSTRLVRGWTHLERQKGGIGLRGPGETQLETDRRLLGKRIKYLHGRLEKVSKQRAQSRQSRQKAEVSTVSLVGYTNAGKSTLFNHLTNEHIYAADQLFATLDPTLRKLKVNDHLSVILADTVGFIRHLPHDLIAAFKATLLETCEADLLIHVIDFVDEEKREKIDAVLEVLAEIDAGDIPQLLVYNKIDLAEIEPRIDRDENGRVSKVFLSSKTAKGIPLLLQALDETLSIKRFNMSAILLPSEGALKAWLYEEGTITDESYLDNGQVEVSLEITQAQMKKSLRRFGIEEQRFIAQ
ncbi:MAG: GTPase HflX [Gammaproteobacteria bacterium]|nr:GTPase HflX [Gammaproteobacteria bacterium]